MRWIVRGRRWLVLVPALGLLARGENAGAGGFDPSDPTDTMVDLTADLLSEDGSTALAAADTALRFASVVPASLLTLAFVDVDRAGDHREEPELAAIVSNAVPGVDFTPDTRGDAALALANLAIDEEVPLGKGAKGDGPDRLIDLSSPSQDALLSCLGATVDIALRRACVRAVGIGRVFSAIPTLEAISSEASQDPILRLIAERSLTTLENSPRVRRRTLDDVDAAVHKALAEGQEGAAP